MTQASPSPRPVAVDDAAFAAAVAKFALPHNAKLAAGVSGGADSMALLLLLREWCAHHDASLTALTVDHCLRNESAVEAAQVATWCASLGIAHATLRWEEGAAQRGLSRSPQAAARTARYELLTAWCRAHGHSHLCLAHHADDQVETFLLRLSRGSGVDGLAAMAPLCQRDGITLIRPLLDFPKDSLRAALVAAGQSWIEDPSNQNRRSARVRFRQARALLAAEGLGDERLLSTISHLQRAKKALALGVDGLLAGACAWDLWGTARLELAAFIAAPEEISLRALARVLTTVSGVEYSPRFERLQRLHAALCSGPWRDATLHGCHIVREGNAVRICREAGAIEGECSVRNGETVTWDRRFRIAVPQGDDLSFIVRRLTPEAWTLASTAAAIAHMPRLIRDSLPMLTDAHGLAVIPWAPYIRSDLQSRLKGQVLWGFAPDFAHLGQDGD
jgi:tRNA(Ile)-lysidine synthase